MGESDDSWTIDWSDDENDRRPPAPQVVLSGNLGTATLDRQFNCRKLGKSCSDGWKDDVLRSLTISRPKQPPPPPPVSNRVSLFAQKKQQNDVGTCGRSSRQIVRSLTTALTIDHSSFQNTINQHTLPNQMEFMSVKERAPSLPPPLAVKPQLLARSQNNSGHFMNVSDGSSGTSCTSSPACSVAENHSANSTGDNSLRSSAESDPSTDISAELAPDDANLELGHYQKRNSTTPSCSNNHVILHIGTADFTLWQKWHRAPVSSKQH